MLPVLPFCAFTSPEKYTEPKAHRKLVSPPQQLPRALTHIQILITLMEPGKVTYSSGYPQSLEQG